MNARIYDPILHTFLSPDALIADPSNPQNYNRYAYALNNPLMYVDYDGNEVVITTAAVLTAVIIGAVIGGVTYVGLSLYNGTAITWGGLAKSILVGAVSGAASAGIGGIIGSASTAICTAAPTLTQLQINLMLTIPQALMHGIAQGVIQGISGGNANQSFVTAALTSIATGGFAMTGSFGSSIGGQALFGAVMGGIVSDMQGGNFWEGAAIGLTVSLLNHAGQKLNEAIEKIRATNGLARSIAKQYGYKDWREIKAFLVKYPFTPTHKGVSMAGKEVLSSKNIEDDKTVGNYLEDTATSELQSAIVEFISPKIGDIMFWADNLLSTQSLNMQEPYQNHVIRYNQAVSRLIRYFFEKPVEYRPSPQKTIYHSSRFDQMNYRFY